MARMGVRKAAGRRPAPRQVPVELAPGDLAAIVAAVAAEPRCRSCGGPVELRPRSGGGTDLVVDHQNGCAVAAEHMAGA